MHAQVEAPLVLGEIVGQDVSARGRRIRGRHGKPGQLVDPVDRPHPERLPAMLPGTPGSVVRIEDDERTRVR